jgi:integration host factor subunit beta
MATLTRKDFIDQIADDVKIKPSTVKTVIHCFLDEIVSELAKGNRMEFRDFGVFEVREQAARIARNPKTLERIEVPAKRRVKFKMGRIMREGMNDHL